MPCAAIAVRRTWHDVTRLTEDMNQEDLSLSALLEKLRHVLCPDRCGTTGAAPDESAPLHTARRL